MNKHLRSLAEMAFILNLDRRTDRWASVSAELDRVGIDAHRLSGIDGHVLPSRLIPGDIGISRPLAEGPIGCLHAHLMAIRLAKDLGLRGVLILEDDVRFSRDFLERLPSVCASIPSDWDLVFLGGVAKLGKVHVARQIVRSTFTYMNYAYLVRDKAYDACIETLLTRQHWNDMLLGGLCTRLRAYQVVPNMANQTPRHLDSDTLGHGPHRFPRAVQHASTITGWMSIPELSWLHRECKSHTNGLQLGAFCGRSSFVIGRCLMGTLLDLDAWGLVGPLPPEISLPGISSYKDVLASYRSTMASLLRSSKVIAVRCKHDTPDVLRHVSSVFPASERPTFLFMDGDHSVEGVSRDIRTCLSAMGGGSPTLAGHDYDHPSYPGVREAVHAEFGNAVKRGPDSIWYVKL